MRYAGRITAGLLALAILGQASSADQPSPGDKIDRKAIDTALYDTLRGVINKGADMYNNGDMTGCYRLFEGALMTAKPMLAHRPELQKTIAKALTAADGDAVTFRRAFALRAALDKVRAELNPKAKKDNLPPPDPEDKKDADKAKAEKEKANKAKLEKEKADKEKEKEQKDKAKLEKDQADKAKLEKEKAAKEKKEKEQQDKDKADKEKVVDEKDDAKEKLPAPKSEPKDK